MQWLYPKIKMHHIVLQCSSQQFETEQIELSVSRRKDTIVRWKSYCKQDYYCRNTLNKTETCSKMLGINSERRHLSNEFEI